MTCQGDESPIAQNNRPKSASREWKTAAAMNPFALRDEGVKNEGQSIR